MKDIVFSVEKMRSQESEFVEKIDCCCVPWAPHLDLEVLCVFQWILPESTDFCEICRFRDAANPWISMKCAVWACHQVRSFFLRKINKCSYSSVFF